MATLSSQLKLTVLDGVTGPMRRINGVLNGFQRQQTAALAPFRGVAGQLLAFGAGYIGVSKGISSTVGAAMDFESAFADVKKVVNASDAQFEMMSRSIRKMSTELPLASTEIAQLFAAAGEFGIATNELQSFAEMAARVGIAFDMSAGEAGESLAKLKAQLGLTVIQTGEMADAINHLSNNMASKAKDITAYMLRVGKFAEMGGFAKEQVAAIGSAMISAGAEAETAGTAMMNVVRKMTAGEFAKKDQQEAAKALGLDLPTLAKQMKKDAPKALKTVLKAIAKAPAEKQIALLSKFFGDEARAFAPLVGNIGLLDKAFDLVADRSNYAGSAFKEFVARADTTANALQILRNKIAYIFEDIGMAWLPSLKEGIADLGHVLDTLDSRFTIFDEFKSRIGGFLSGLGLGDGKDVIKGIRDFIFGAEDASAAADKYGRLFGQFQEYGRSIREFGKEIKDNPVVKFLSDLSPWYIEALKWSIGFALVAGAVMKLARAVAFLTGITTAIGIIKSLGSIGGILGGAAGFPGLGGGKPGGTPGGTPAGNTPAVGWWSRVGTWFKGLGMGAAIGSVPQILSDTPGDTFEKQVENQAKFKSFVEGIVGLKNDENGVPGWKRFLFGDAADPNFDSRQHFGIQTKAGDDTSGSPRTTGEMLAGLDKPVTLDSATISQIVNPRGVQDVRVTNKERPNITVHAPVTISNISSPQEAVDAAASRLGQRIKAEIEAADTD